MLQGKILQVFQTLGMQSSNTERLITTQLLYYTPTENLHTEREKKKTKNHQIHVSLQFSDPEIKAEFHRTFTALHYCNAAFSAAPDSINKIKP